MTNKWNKVLYIGVTNNLWRRVEEHKMHLNKGFTSKYNVEKLVYYEEFNDPSDAIAREKQLKDRSRQKKIDLIESVNKEWRDLYKNPLQ